MTLRLDFPGASGDYVSTPDTAVLDIVGDIDMRAEINLDALDGEALAKWTVSGSQLSYRLETASDTKCYLYHHDGAVRSQGSDTGMISIGTHDQIRGTLDVDNGSSERVYTFYTRSPGTALSDNTGWTQHSTHTVAGTSSISASTAILELGSFNVGANSRMNGQLYGVCLMDGIDGTVVLNADFTDESGYDVDFTQFTEAANGLVLTLNGNVSVIGQATSTTTGFRTGLGLGV